VKVVGGSEIYNFHIHHFVHFYSKFLRKSRSNVASPTQKNRPRAARAPARAAARQPAPRPRHQRCAPPEAAHAPSPGLPASLDASKPPSRRAPGHAPRQAGRTGTCRTAGPMATPCPCAPYSGVLPSSSHIVSWTSVI
jgi:hypothetical protein